MSTLSHRRHAVSEVIRPAAIVPEDAARAVLLELARRDVQNGGVWESEPTTWSLWDRPWLPSGGAGDAQLLGSLHVAYGTPTRYEITIYRVTVTAAGLDAGWTVESMTDEALRHGGLTLAACPRAQLAQPPKPFRH